MNKSQELMKQINEFQDRQEDYSIDLERDRELIESIYGPIVTETTEESLAFLDMVILQRKAKNG